MMPGKKKLAFLRKTTVDEDRNTKDAAFLGLPPEQRLKVAEELRRRIWRDRYDTPSLAGLKVRKKRMEP